MIILFHCLSARSFRPLWALQELGLDCDLRMLPFPPRVYDKTYLAHNPLGTVPLLIDGETRMTESAAICQYLAARYGNGSLDVSPNNVNYGDYLNFLHFGEATLTFPQTLILRYHYFETLERRQPQVADDYSKWFLARLRNLESRLTNREFLCGDQFNAADISVGYALLLAQHLSLDKQFTPSVALYWQRLQNRTGYKRAQSLQLDAARNQGISQVASPDIRP